MDKPYIPTALSKREDAVLQHYARDKTVVEAGALLGHSTIQLASVAKRVISIDRHCGYQYWPNDTLRMFKRNLEVTGVARKVQWIVGDCHLLANYRADFAFIDLCGTYANTLAAIRAARAPHIAVHDYERQSCRGVALAVMASGYKIVERVDSLIVLQR
jgi:hypothetical protein